MGVRVPRIDIRRRLTGMDVYYGWIIVGACFISGLITWGTIWSFGVFFGYVVEDFGLSHANTSVVFSLQQIITFSGAAVIGFVIDRYGARRLLLVATALVVGGLLGVRQFTSFAGVLISYGVVAAAGFGIVFVISYATPTRWFGRRRGIATGIATAGAGVGVVAVPPIAEFLIGQVGWRNAYAMLTVAFVLALVIAALLLADRPDDLAVDTTTEFPDGNPAHSPLDADWRTQLADVVGVVRTPSFGLVFVAFLCLAAPMVVLLVNIVEYTTNVGFGRTVGVTAISVLGAMNVVGKFVGGAASDRIGRPYTIAASSGFMCVGMAVLLLAHVPTAVLGAAVIFGFGWGIWIGLLGPLLADLFGTLSINALFGITTIAFALSNSIAPYLAGLGFDIFGTFRPAFAIAGAIGVVGGGLVLLAARLAPAR